MSNPFLDVQQALTNMTGIDFVLSGIILGSVLSVAMMICLIFVLDPKGKDSSGLTMMLSAGLGVAISTAVGWFPPWIVIFIAIVLAFIVFNPFDSQRATR